jgi:hypothetical protein
MTGIIAQNVGRTSGLIKAASGGSGGVWTKIKEITASADSTIDFIDGTDDVVLDSTYPIYVFKFINMHPENNTSQLYMDRSVDGGSNFEATPTTNTCFRAFHSEGGNAGILSYYTSADRADSNSAVYLSVESSGENDHAVSGTFTLFNPSSTTFVKHYIMISNSVWNNDNDDDDDNTMNFYVSGYFDTTSAMDGIRFRFNTGNIDVGTIKLYGIKDS